MGGKRHGKRAMKEKTQAYDVSSIPKCLAVLLIHDFSNCHLYRKHKPGPPHYATCCPPVISQRVFKRCHNKRICETELLLLLYALPSLHEREGTEREEGKESKYTAKGGT